MKTTKERVQEFFIASFIVIIGLLVMQIKIQKPASEPTFSAGDSTAIDSIKNRIDTIKIRETVWRTKIKTVRETDTVVYVGTDTTCLEIIERKNRLIEGLDSLTLALDEEARLYSDLNVVYLKRNAALSDSASSLRVLYNDSLTMQRKHYKKKLFWTNVKLGVFTTLGIVGTVQLVK